MVGVGLKYLIITSKDLGLSNHFSIFMMFKISVQDTKVYSILNPISQIKKKYTDFLKILTFLCSFEEEGHIALHLLVSWTMSVGQ
jgi:hypothetical protein